jgi:hypothetical protein
VDEELKGAKEGAGHRPRDGFGGFLNGCSPPVVACRKTELLCFAS